MSNKTSKRIAYALHHGEILTLSNTRTDGESVWLFDNRIAHLSEGVLEISSCGWRTKTTKDRLNAILEEFGQDSYIYQVDYTWYIQYPEYQELFLDNTMFTL